MSRHVVKIQFYGTFVAHFEISFVPAGSDGNISIPTSMKSLIYSAYQGRKWNSSMFTSHQLFLTLRILMETSRIRKIWHLPFSRFEVFDVRVFCLFLMFLSSKSLTFFSGRKEVYVWLSAIFLSDELLQASFVQHIFLDAVSCCHHGSTTKWRQCYTHSLETNAWNPHETLCCRIMFHGIHVKQATRSWL